jgi:hypothetical protein
MGLLRRLNDVGGEKYRIGKDGKRRHKGGKVEKTRGNTTEIKKLATYP